MTDPTLAQQKIDALDRLLEAKVRENHELYAANRDLRIEIDRLRDAVDNADLKLQDRDAEIARLRKALRQTQCECASELVEYADPAPCVRCAALEEGEA